ncbi:hypothetical protein [Xenorhabdus szentirmaii]|uniref:hypothetical protein n=1 Tax=Xenorhabdus szentirmaii TaxID=290112 RepID=UPI001984CB3C|nr:MULTISPECIES: hypothetical protein [unclassified Xenorhabdus]MBD2806561.1 hypothetical protein [Xenorhabdus sp. ZM]MBD2825581.1 hypothetical protein [Xenorhabdus sp. 5]
MEDFLFFVAGLSFLMFIIGLLKPKIVLMPNRKVSSLVSLVVFFTSIITAGQLFPSKYSTPPQQTTVKTVAAPAPKPFKYADMTLKEYRSEHKEDKKEIVEKYIAYKNIVGQETDGFYSCLSQMSYTKSEDLKLGEVLGWCYNDYSQNPASLSKYINFDEYRSKFDIWNGSYRPLEKIIKENMHDESSYKHISTVNRRVLSGDNPYAIVKTTFSGTNLYGARVKQYLAAKVDIKTGEIIELITEE